MYGIAPHMLHVWCSCSPSYMRRAGIDLNESLRAGKLDSSGNRSRHCRGRRLSLRIGMNYAPCIWRSLPLIRAVGCVAVAI